ncbi:MAG: hypothetical protein J6J03_00435 [Tyzzerella sp.]|nr:hypothetical protein [Tyzzerella sp.]
MFGYVVAHKPELKMREFHKYKAYYCGLCKVLREKYGFLGQVTLTYDMTFLVILLTSLYESESKVEEKRCVVHPVKKQKMLYNEITEYAADMNIVLTYHKLLDDWKDEKSKKSLVGLRALRGTYLELEEKYPEKCRVIRKCMHLLAQCEKRGEENIDITARYFGELMSELFVYKQDVWEKTLRRMGFYLGKFIYIMDAYDDVEKDMEQGNYNALIILYGQPDFDDKCKDMMNYVLAECTSQFERLPCVEDVEILRNILYAGVWSRYDKKRTGEEENDSKSL